MEKADSGKPPPLFDRSGSPGEGSCEAEEGLTSGDASADLDCEIAVAALMGCRSEGDFELSVDAAFVGILKPEAAPDRDDEGKSSALR